MSLKVAVIVGENLKKYVWVLSKKYRNVKNLEQWSRFHSDWWCFCSSKKLLQTCEPPFPFRSSSNPLLLNVIRIKYPLHLLAESMCAKIRICACKSVRRRPRSRNYLGEDAQEMSSDRNCWCLLILCAFLMQNALVLLWYFLIWWLCWLKWLTFADTEPHYWTSATKVFLATEPRKKKKPKKHI